MALQARLTITGRVQGVGYRDWAITTGRRLGLTGWVRNRRDGAVEALIVGDEDAVGQMIEACRRGPSLARVDEIDVDPVDLDILPARLHPAADGVSDDGKTKATQRRSRRSQERSTEIAARQVRSLHSGSR